MSEYLDLHDPVNQWTEDSDSPRRLEVPLGQDPAVAAPSALLPCPDCSNYISRHAEACPHCGRFIQNCRRPDALMVVPGNGWVSTVAWGIVISSFLWGAIVVGLFVVGVVILMALAGVGASVPRR